ncbi:MAG: hypothetical protein MR392_09070 [Roseburia sp.]|nr:hypothetical protein [Roseburia sp.]
MAVSTSWQQGRNAGKSEPLSEPLASSGAGLVIEAFLPQVLRSPYSLDVFTKPTDRNDASPEIKRSKVW